MEVWEEGDLISDLLPSVLIRNYRLALATYLRYKPTNLPIHLTNVPI